MITSRKSFAPFKPLALILVGVLAGACFSDMLRPAAALAQDGKPIPPEKLLNSADQYRIIAANINQTNERLARIETLLSNGVKVRVTEMPAVAKDK